ncbi:MAG TPA: hypothetical protein VES42_28120, partial [Pilimelia sp.]|nr:hypothetical protein [Pilimelia sp.]
LSYRPGGNPDPYTAVGDLAWSPPAGGAARYRVYDGGALVAETAAPTLAVRLAGGTRHGYAVTAVDAAGMESVPSAPVQVVASFLPPP